MKHVEKHNFTKAELVSILDACIEKTLGDVDKNHVFNKTITSPKITGIAGDVIEQSVLGYPADPSSEPDLIVDGEKVELKTTGIRISKNNGASFEAKEPMSITAVSPERITDEQFYDSKFWHKLEKMLIVYYLYTATHVVPAAEYANFPIKGYDFHKFSKVDEDALKKDWEIVRDFIKQIKDENDIPEDQYPRLSYELRDRLLMIDTAPKWPHRPRFRLKRSVVTTMVQEFFGKTFERLPENYSTYNEIDKKCRRLEKEYSGKTIQDIASLFGITNDLNGKSIGEQITINMFGGKSTKMNKIELFSKIGLIGKTIVVTDKGSRTEDMKLFSIDFNELSQPNMRFRDSSFYEFFANHQMLCIQFEEPSLEAPLSQNKFVRFKRIQFSEEFIEKNVRPVWLKIRRLILSGRLKDVVIYDKDNVPIKNKNGVIRSAPNFPKSSDGIVFVRGSSKDSSVKTEEINGIKMYKQFIWIKGSYIAEELFKDLNLL